MKKPFIFALLFALVFPIFIYSQKNFAPLNAEWKYEAHSIDCTGNHLKYEVVSESIIMGNDCSVIHSFYWEDAASDWIVQDSLVVWEDQNKIYFLSDTSFYLLFDFEALAGDTVWSYDPLDKLLFSVYGAGENQETPSLARYIVDEVDEIEIEGEVRKIFATSVLEENGFCVRKKTIVENIGSTSMGFAGENCYYVTKGCFGSMVCYTNEHVFYETGFLSCDSLTNSDELALAEKVKVFPNPIEHNLFIQTPDNVQIQAYELISLNGEVVKSGIFMGQISTISLESGLYILRLSLRGQQVINKKIVVQH